MNVFLLSHSRKTEDDAICYKIIGIYSSLINAQKTIIDYKSIVGFKDYPNNFCIEEFEITSFNNECALSNHTVFFLQHEYSVREYEYITNIGMFFSHKDAKKYIDKLKEDISLQEQYNILFPDGEFSIANYIIDKNYWAEGFSEYE